jgi:hypothetical protein
MGNGYILGFDFVSAARYLDIAQGKFAMLGNMGRHCEVRVRVWVGVSVRVRVIVRSFRDSSG